MFDQNEYSRPFYENKHYDFTKMPDTAKFDIFTEAIRKNTRLWTRLITLQARYQKRYTRASQIMPDSSVGKKILLLLQETNPDMISAPLRHRGGPKPSVFDEVNREWKTILVENQSRTGKTDAEIDEIAGNLLSDVDIGDVDI